MSELLTGSTYTTEQLSHIVLWKQGGLDWPEIAENFNKKFKKDKKPKTANALRHVYREYGNIFEASDKNVQLAQLKEVFRTKKTNSRTAKENKVILENLVNEEDLLEAIKTTVQEIGAKKQVLPKIKVSKNRPNMTLELLLTDIHYGKKTDTFNLKVCRSRMQEFTSVVLKEIDRNSKLYNVEKIIAALLGDIIESETMHGLESARGCEFGNSEQVQAAIESLFHDVLVPLASTGLPIFVPAVTGNHDRTDKDKSYSQRGRTNVTWIIYNTLELLCKQSGFTNVTFEISESTYIVHDVYGDIVLYEHGDQVGNTAEDTLYKLMAKRSRQVKKIIKFMRLGHFHKRVEYGRGEIIIGESVAGPDGFSDIHGFSSNAGQTINYYINSNGERPTSFFRSFPVCLK